MTGWLFVAVLSCAALPSLPVEFDDVVLHDARGLRWSLANRSENRSLVVVFVGAECPLAKLYAERLAELARTFGPLGVEFVAVDSNPQDSQDDLARFEQENPLGFPLVSDCDGSMSARLGATRTPEAFVLDRDGRICYQGRIDDQYTIGGRKPAPARRDLAEALIEVLAGRPVSIARTDATGCAIARRKPVENATAEVTYAQHIAPILQKHCVVCHRPGQVAPFALTSFEQARDWAATIREVVADNRMPPWHADPRFGRFANDPSLNDEEKAQIEAWTRGGCPPGDLGDLPPPVKFPEGWAIGEPDVVITMPQPFRVPATGVIEYQLIELDPGFKTDTWVSAAEIRPGNRAVVHHATVFLKPPGESEVAESGSLGSLCLVATAPGTPALVLPSGMAKLVPAGWKFVLVVHYTAIGSAQTDRTSIGLRLIDAAQVKREVATRLILDEHLSIPPFVSDHRVAHSWRVPRDVLILSMFPHLHARGKSFRYEAVYPDGTQDVLLDVPRYDVNWQNRYDLAEPKLLPAGTLVRCTAHYDNSSANPRNPDPSRAVHTGPQSWDEMFNGYFDVVPAEESGSPAPAGPRLRLAVLTCMGVLLAGLALHARRSQDDAFRTSTL